MVSKAERSDEGSVDPKHAYARTRVLVAFAAGIVAFGVASLLTPWQVAALLGWNAAAVVFIAWVWLSIGGMNSEETAKLATMEDDSRTAADLVLISATWVSLLGVALTFLKAGGENGAGKALITAVASIALILSWGAVHTVFTLRYASLYYMEGGGIDFNEATPPDYGDFAYLAFTIGMTYQVSDTNLTSKSIRRTALRHAFLSFVFGTGVIAMTINVVAGLFNK